jgi:hypothetical protein
VVGNDFPFRAEGASHSAAEFAVRAPPGQFNPPPLIGLFVARSAEHLKVRWKLGAQTLVGSVMHLQRYHAARHLALLAAPTERDGHSDPAKAELARGAVRGDEGGPALACSYLVAC